MSESNSIASTSKVTLDSNSIPNPSSVAAQARSTLPPQKTNKVPFFGNAAQPEIVRANQKDLYYLSQLTEQFEDVSRSLLGTSLSYYSYCIIQANVGFDVGTRWLQNWSKELGQGSRLAYFGLTTLLGSQTLGEEYCDIMQYSVQNRKPPSQRRRAILLSLHILVPYLISRIYAATRRALIRRHTASEEIRLQNDSLDSLFSTSPPPPPPKSRLQKLLDGLASYALDLPSFETLTEDYLRSIHLAIFYLTGRYYNLSKRAAGIRFISTQAQRAPTSASASTIAPPSSYEVLGVLMAVQLIVRTFLAIRHKRQAAAALLLSQSPNPIENNEKKKQSFTVDGKNLTSLIFDPDDPDQASPYPEEETGIDARDRRCTLCLGTRRDPAATECGHVFCWECIVGWAREKPECPLCRQTIALNKLLPVINL